MRPQEDSALKSAIGNADLKKVQELLKGQPNLKASGPEGFTPLHRTVYWTQYDMVWARPFDKIIEALLSGGAEIDARDVQGATPLIWAARKGHDDLALVLIKRGAALSLADNLGATALTYALWRRGSEDNDLAQELRKRKSPINLWDALWLGDEPIALRLAERVDPKAVGPERFTYLHLAALLGSAKVAEFLLAHGADIQARMENGWTPLHLACGGIPQAAIPSMTTHWTKYGPIDGREELVRLLLSAKANLYARDDDRRLPRDWAAGLKRPELAALLARSTGRRG